MSTTPVSKKCSASARISYDRRRTDNDRRFWLMVSPSDANREAPYSARFHFGASAPRG